DDPTLTVTTSTPTMTEDQAAQSLYTNAAAGYGDADGSESGDRITGMTITVTNVDDSGYEFLNINSGACDLTNSNSETTSLGGSDLTCAVSVSSTTATVTLSHSGLTSAQIVTLVNGMEYENTDEDPATGNTRVVTITTMTDDGGTANSGDNDAALSLASTVTVAAADNDAPVNTVAGAAANEDVAVAISGTSIADVDDSSLDSVRITVTLGTFTLATSSATYDDGTQGTPDNDVTISGTIANINTALATITWTSASNDNTNAVFTILSDDGPNTDSDDFTVTVTAINDEPSIACTGGTPTFAEDGNAVSLFSSCTVLAGGAGGDAESDDIASMVFTVTNVADTTETINFDGSA
ncbi:uncharacterized protein METZ01_LOCUS257773, partial [marine metagenome]